MKVDQFFQSDYADYATYDNYRSIASYIDGLKPSQRKVLHVLAKNNIISPTKVEQLQSKIAEQTEYLHGAHSLAGVIVNLATSYVGTNNVPLIQPKGNFGTRCVQQAAAGRYIYAAKAQVFDKIFRPEDRPILTQQEFEGTVIEPRFFLPTLPMILVNGAEGIGNGYRQKILPRDPKLLAKLVSEYVTKGKLPKSIPPFFQGFSGTVTAGENPGSWVITGTIEKVDRTTIRVTEVPVGYDLEDYAKKLDDLEEKKVIKGYTDRSDGRNQLQFDVRVDLEFMRKPVDWQLNTLKLVKKIGETFTCFDENNAPMEFGSEVEILKAYCDYRLTKYTERKAYQEGKLAEDLEYLKSRARFIQLFISDKIKVVRMCRQFIEEQLEDLDFIQKDGSFDYLVGMPIYSLTEEKIMQLETDIQKKQKELEEVKATTAETMWFSDLKETVK